MTQDIALKAACADNFYYPQEWDPSRGSLDQFQRSRGFEHHFGKQRTKNLHKGVLVIRFEMPFKVQCLRCGTYIGQGSRYDADKKKVGMYFSSPIYEFAMRCRVSVDPSKSADGRAYCNQRFVIRTDPQNDDYALTEGLRKKVEEWDPQDTETAEIHDRATREKMMTDPMFKAEKTIRNAQREREQKDRLADLIDLKAENEDDYDLNCMLRKQHRQKRKEEQARLEEEAKKPPPNFGVALQPPSEEDAREARAVRYRTDEDRVEVAVRRAVARAAPLFGSATGQAARIAELAGKRRRLLQHAQVERSCAARATGG